VEPADIQPKEKMYRLPSSFGPVLNKKLASGAPLAPEEYNKLVRLVAAPILLDTLKPPRNFLRSVAEKMLN
jgi:hypothetical protein